MPETSKATSKLDSAVTRWFWVRMDGFFARFIVFRGFRAVDVAVVRVVSVARAMAVNARERSIIYGGGLSVEEKARCCTKRRRGGGDGGREVVY